MEQLDLGISKSAPVSIVVEFKRQYKHCVRSFRNVNEGKAIEEARKYMEFLYKDCSIKEVEMLRDKDIIARWIR